MPEKQDDFLKKHSNPSYWRERIDDDLQADCRQDWLHQNLRAKELLKGESGDNPYWSAMYPRIRRAFSGRMFYGEIRPKVSGVPSSDREVANMFRYAIDFEFTRARGLYQRIGRAELRSALFNWLDFGLGGMHVYFDPCARDHENFTGSIITESVEAESIILDSSVKRLRDVGHMARRYEINQMKAESMLPQFKGRLPLDNDDRCYLYEVQFRTSKPTKVKLNTPEMAEMAGDYRPYFEKKDDLMNRFAADRRMEAEQLWKTLRYDYAAVPMCYALMFVGDTRGEAHCPSELVQPPVYIGRDFNYCLIEFCENPDSPYPFGAPYFLEGLIRYASDSGALFMKLAKAQDNSGGAVDISHVVADGVDSLAKMREVKRMIDEGKWVMVEGVNNLNEVFKQKEPPRIPLGILEGKALCETEIHDFFNTHREQLGQSPYAGAPAKLVEVLQASGGFALGDSIDSMRSFVGNIFRQISRLTYRFMPADKRIAVSDVDGNTELKLLSREQMLQYDPNDLNITVELDVDSERDKLNKSARAQALTAMGAMSLRRLLLESGYHDADRILSEVSDQQTGQQLVAIMKEDQGFAQMVNEYIKMKAIQEQQENA